MRVKCFWVEKVWPEVIDWENGIGSPRHRRLDTGEILQGRLPVGALIARKVEGQDDTGWTYDGGDGFSVMCVTPGGDWYIDSRARNCGSKNDSKHRCWVRHGTKGGTLHVDKNGPTCSAGAGSIQCGDFHGFLHNGELYSC